MFLTSFVLSTVVLQAASDNFATYLLDGTSRQFDLSQAGNYVGSQQDSAKLGCDKASVKKLAEDAGLYKTRTANPHLEFLGGDVSWWAGECRTISISRLQAEFAARSVVLEAADRDDIYIETQGDLSAISQSLVGKILRALRKQ